MERKYGPNRDEADLSDASPADMVRSIPSEESAIQIAETSSRADIQNQIAQLSADIELRKASIAQAQAELEAVEFALGVYQRAGQLAQDINPGV